MAKVAWFWTFLILLVFAIGLASCAPVLERVAERGNFYCESGEPNVLALTVRRLNQRLLDAGAEWSLRLGDAIDCNEEKE